jgi:RNA polymerase sigma factor (sigma-70 family)
VKSQEINEAAVTDFPDTRTLDDTVSTDVALSDGVARQGASRTLEQTPDDPDFGTDAGVEDPGTTPITEDVEDLFEDPDSDERLPQSGRITDEASFTEFYTAHSGYLQRLLMSKGLSPADAEDVSQNAFANAWKSRERFDGGNPRGWLTRIAMNESVSLHRVEQRRPLQVTDDEQRDAAFRNAVGTERDPADVIVDREDASRAVHAVRDSGIPNHWKQIMWYKHGLGYKDQETADVIGSNRNSVATGAMRAMRQIRDSLDIQE